MRIEGGIAKTRWESATDSHWVKIGLMPKRGTNSDQEFCRKFWHKYVSSSGHLLSFWDKRFVCRHCWWFLAWFWIFKVKLANHIKSASLKTKSLYNVYRCVGLYEWRITGMQSPTSWCWWTSFKSVTQTDRGEFPVNTLKLKKSCVWFQSSWHGNNV